MFAEQPVLGSYYKRPQPGRHCDGLLGSALRVRRAQGPPMREGAPSLWHTLANARARAGDHAEHRTGL
jgi:hypothetical protein